MMNEDDDNHENTAVVDEGLPPPTTTTTMESGNDENEIVVDGDHRQQQRQDQQQKHPPLPTAKQAAPLPQPVELLPDEPTVRHLHHQHRPEEQLPNVGITSPHTTVSQLPPQHTDDSCSSSVGSSYVGNILRNRRKQNYDDGGSNLGTTRSEQRLRRSLLLTSNNNNFGSSVNNNIGLYTMSGDSMRGTTDSISINSSRRRHLPQQQRPATSTEVMHLDSSTRSALQYYGGHHGAGGGNGGSLGLSLRDSIALEVRKSVTYEVKKEMSLLLLQQQESLLDKSDCRNHRHDTKHQSSPSVLHYYDVDDDVYDNNKDDDGVARSERLGGASSSTRINTTCSKTEDIKATQLENPEHHLLKLLTRIFRYKLMFAFAFGFINAVTFLQSRTYATMMTGNLLKLTNQLMQAMIDEEPHEKFYIGDGEALFTFVLIICYEFGASFFFLIWFNRNHYYIPFMLLKVIQNQVMPTTTTMTPKSNKWVTKDDSNNKKSIMTYVKDHFIVIVVIVVSVFMGVSSDVIQKLNGCKMSSINENECELTSTSIEHKYYLFPIAIITGMVSGGYLTSHPTGVTTNMVTGHFGKVAQMMMKLFVNCIIQKSQHAGFLLEESQYDRSIHDGDDDYDDIEANNNKKKNDTSKNDSTFHLCCCGGGGDENGDADWDSLKQSLGIIIFFFSGALVGMFMPKDMMSIHHNVPIFTIFGVSLAVLVGLFDRTYRESVKYVVIVEEQQQHQQRNDGFDDPTDLPFMGGEPAEEPVPEIDTSRKERFNNLLQRLEEDVEHEDLGD